MIFTALHLIAYVALAEVIVLGGHRIAFRRRTNSRRALLARITHLEQELGLGIDWALDRLDDFVPILSRPALPGYSSLHEYAFRCYGCGESVVYADYGKRSNRVRDSRHLLCDSCLPREAHG